MPPRHAKRVYSARTWQIAKELKERVVAQGEVVDRENFLREHERDGTLSGATDAIDIVTGFKRVFNKVTRDGPVEEVIGINRNKRRLLVSRTESEDNQPEVSHHLGEFAENSSRRRR